MKKILLYVVLCLPFLCYSQDQGVLETKKLLINRMGVEGHHKMSLDSLMHVLLPQIGKERDSLLERHAHQPGQQAVIRYYYANALLHLSERIPQKSVRDMPWEPLLTDRIFADNALPSVEELIGSQVATLFVDEYVRYRLIELFLRIRDEGEQIMVRSLGHPMDSLQKIASQYGELALGLLYAKNILPPELAARYLSKQLDKYMEMKNLSMSELILGELITHFPADPSIPKGTMEIAQFHELLTMNSRNPDIVFIRNMDSIGSVADLLSPFAGKVVYLDFWGTWCGPCVLEMTQHNQPLKARFKEEKDLVFLYIAMERPDDHEKWKRFIALHNLTGYHLTKTADALEPIWEELLGTQDVPREYPTYMIFDRHGNLVNPQAHRPSEGEALYLQLEAMFTNAFEAMDYLGKHSVDLLFLDIKMPDISGIDFFNSLNRKPLVVFTTAYSEHAVTGFELDAVDYLLKPFSLSRFLKACNKAQDILTLRQGNGELKPDFIFVKTGYEQVRIRFDEITYLEASGNYVTFVLVEQQVLSRMTITECEALLPASAFIRIHRSFIVAIEKIQRIERHQVHVNGHVLPVGSSYSSGLIG